MFFFNACFIFALLCYSEYRVETVVLSDHVNSCFTDQATDGLDLIFVRGGGGLFEKHFQKHPLDKSIIA